MPNSSRAFEGRGDSNSPSYEREYARLSPQEQQRVLNELERAFLAGAIHIPASPESRAERKTSTQSCWTETASYSVGGGRGEQG